MASDVFTHIFKKKQYVFKVLILTYAKIYIFASCLKKCVMVRIIVLFTILLFYMSSTAQYMLISYQDFEKAVFRLGGMGYTHYVDDSEEEEDEYRIYYRNASDDILMFTLYSSRAGAIWFGTPYLFEGTKAEYGEIGGMYIFVVEIEALNAVFTIASTKDLGKSEFERMAIGTGLLTQAPASLSWPSNIKAPYRLSGIILEVGESKADAEGFKKVCAVTMQMNEELNSSFKSLTEKFRADGENIYFPDGTLLLYPFQGDDNLYDNLGDGQSVKFLYYIP